LSGICLCHHATLDKRHRHVFVLYVIEMTMLLAQEGTKEPEIEIYIPDHEIEETSDGMHIIHNHTVRERNVPHLLPGNKIYLYERDISAHHKKDARTKEHIVTEIGIGPTLDAKFTRGSFREVLKHVDPKDRSTVVDEILRSIKASNTYLLFNTSEARLICNQGAFGLTPRFAIDGEGYSINEAYDDPVKMIFDSEGKVVGENPYYISKLVGTPTVRRPHRIEASFDVLQYRNMLIGVFAGLNIEGPWDDITKAYAASGLAKKITSGTARFSDVPRIVWPFFSTHIIPSDI
jgi:hypothetical protein